MSNGGININISGGNAAFGNVSQGDNNKLDHTETNTNNLKGMEELLLAINDSSKANNIDPGEIEELKIAVQKLSEQTNEKDIMDIAKDLYEKYSWAINPIKKFVAILLP